MAPVGDNLSANPLTEMLGFRGGYGGLDSKCAEEPVILTPQFVDSIHQKGGTILGSSRGPVDIRP